MTAVTGDGLTTLLPIWDSTEAIPRLRLHTQVRRGLGVGSGLGAPAGCRIYPPNRRSKLVWLAAPAAGLPGYCNATLVSTPNGTTK